MKVGQCIGGVTVGVLLSTLVHAGAGGGLYYAFVINKPAPIEVEIDLSMVPLVSPDPTPPTAVQPKTPPPPPSARILPKHEDLPPHVAEDDEPEPGPTPTPVAAEATPELQEAPSTPVEQVAAGSASDVENRDLPAAKVARQPRWVGNLMSSKDYPRIAERAGKDGLVLLSVLIDESGRVQDVLLQRGSYEELNEVALRKVREAVFTPAYNDQGQAVACKVALPIRFELY